MFRYFVAWLFAIVLLGIVPRAFAQEELVELVTGLLADPDKEVRALAFDQIRKEAKGEAATRKFAEFLPKFPAETQIGLLSALADRADPAAAPAVRSLLAASPPEPVRIAALKALGALGGKEDLALLVKLVSAESELVREAARASLIRLPGEASAAMVAELKTPPPSTRVVLLQVLAARRAREAVPDVLAAAADSDPAVRQAALNALVELATGEHVASMLGLVRKAAAGRERDAVEKAVAAVCRQNAEPPNQAEPVLKVLSGSSEAERVVLLPTLGRIGGPAALAVVEKAVNSPREELHAAGVRALCNWPDGSVVSRLLRIARTDADADLQKLALASLIRVAPLDDERDERRRLDALRTVYVMCATDEQRKQVLDRAKAIRHIDTLRFLVPFLEQPEFAPEACQTVVELAHHSSLREANRDEFHRVLDQVIETSRDATIIDRAKRYKAGQTWVRPKNAK
jgi:HEAT repeat protein